jgi:hypothetical protein
MANFNQSPLDQVSIALSPLSLSLGSNAPEGSLEPNTDVYSVDGAEFTEVAFVPFGSMRPAWRRESKILSAKQ